MFAPIASTLRAASLPRSLYMGAATIMGFVVLAVSLSPLAESFIARVFLFYIGALAAYGLLPFVRRGDIPLVAAWVVLLSELAPCVTGQLISPIKVTADIVGVAMAAGPIYVARLRQVLQGDTRPEGRRASELR
ncbi:hypothetical protein [uncultured Phenylobacterium sp.]|uniref:hypothetical protein n=1 Tax=uncultured Phenylobacterium sp. TaxID=349273 RepID=UPI0025FEF126|nr:hypothetical protein [uncultured Phenylobacterium sp.]